MLFIEDYLTVYLVNHRLLGRLPAGPLVPAETRLRIDEAYREDWAFVVDYIKALPYRRS